MDGVEEPQPALKAVPVAAAHRQMTASAGFESTQTESFLKKALYLGAMDGPIEVIVPIAHVMSAQHRGSAARPA
jgi:hypothetical protein